MQKLYNECSCQISICMIWFGWHWSSLDTVWGVGVICRGKKMYNVLYDAGMLWSRKSNVLLSVNICMRTQEHKKSASQESRDQVSRRDTCSSRNSPQSFIPRDRRSSLVPWVKRVKKLIVSYFLINLFLIYLIIKKSNYSNAHYIVSVRGLMG